MTKIVQVVATVEETALAAVAVTGAPGGAGDAVAYTTQSSAATLSNTSRGCDVQYKVGSGSWTDLERGCGIDLAIDFSTTTLYLRRSTLDGGPATCSLSIDGMPVVQVANQTLGSGGGGASTFAALTDKTTVDLPAINTPLANALAAKPTTFAGLSDKTSVDLPATNTPLANALAAKAAADPADGVLTGPYTLTALDNRKTYTSDTALTVSCPNGLSPKPSTIFFPPLTGNLTLTPTGGATLNGSTSPITRAFTGTNKLGVALVPNPYDVNDSIVSGV